MPDFSNLKAAEMDGVNPRPYTINVLEDAPQLWFLPATSANPKFYAETMKRAAERTGPRRGTPEQIAEAARDEDRQILALTCLTKWEVNDAEGNPVELNYENGLEFFRALPDWVFDLIRSWAQNPLNFMRGASKALGEP